MFSLKKSQLIAIIITVCAVLWILSGILFSNDTQSASQETIAQHENDEKAHTKLQSVRIREITPEIHSHDIIVTGRSVADMRIDLRAEASGQLKTLQAERGQNVKKGDLLAEIEVNERNARTLEAQKLVQQRQSEYNAAKTLSEKGFNSRIRLSEAAAQLEAAKARLSEATTTLGKTRITAPFDGIIQERQAEIGDFVSIGDPLFTLVNLDPLKFSGYLSERQIKKLSPGETARIELLDGETLEAKLTYISPSADPQTRTYRIELETPNPDGHLKEGFTAALKIPSEKQSAHKISPSVLTLNDDGRIGVKVLNENNHVVFVPIEILSDHPDHMWIGGLPEGTTRLITVGQEFVQEGQEVEPSLAEGERQL
jgi:membrane fusion protein, multidrug efflux system